MKKITYLLILLSSYTFINSCSPYEDGPKISLRSKQLRITGTWNADSYTRSGENVLNIVYGSLVISTDFEFVINDNGEYTQKYVITTSTGSSSYSVTNEFKGKWQFNADKTQLLLQDEGDTESIAWDILQLKNSELHINAVLQVGEEDIHFIKK